MSSAGGGSLIDVGHHYVDLAVMLGGRVETVFANTHRKKPSRKLTAKKPPFCTSSTRTGQLDIW